METDYERSCTLLLRIRGFFSGVLLCTFLFLLIFLFCYVVGCLWLMAMH